MLPSVSALLAESFDHFRSCGTGRRECVTLWTGPLARPGRVDAVVHPSHTSGPGGYEIDETWLKRFWVDLYEEARTVRVQVHTHPAAAFHSTTDDAFPISQRAGFLSLVVPDFALGDVTLAGAMLYELGNHGQWRELDPAATLLEAA